MHARRRKNLKFQSLDEVISNGTQMRRRPWHPEHAFLG
jgi:hypothetical protein